jgi:hypothetical protein
MLARVSAERVRALLAYEPDTGNLRWRINRKGGARAGSIAGSKMANGYWKIGVDGCEYLAHRLAWLIVHGEWPLAEIDHVNGIPSDNRLSNLREASRAENCQNFKPRRTNSSGHTGVSYARVLSRWHAQIMINGRNVHLGYFDTKEDAADAYRIAKTQVHQFQPEERAA